MFGVLRRESVSSTLLVLNWFKKWLNYQKKVEKLILINCLENENVLLQALLRPDKCIGICIRVKCDPQASPGSSQHNGKSNFPANNQWCEFSEDDLDHFLSFRCGIPCQLLKIAGRRWSICFTGYGSTCEVQEKFISRLTFQKNVGDRSGRFLFDEIFGIDVSGVDFDDDSSSGEKLRNCTCGKLGIWQYSTTGLPLLTFLRRTIFSHSPGLEPWLPGNLHHPQPQITLVIDFVSASNESSVFDSLTSNEHSELLIDCNFRIQVFSDFFLIRLFNIFE